MSADLHCSFCDRHQDNVLVLVAGRNNAFICEGCISVCGEIVDDHRIKDAVKKAVEIALADLAPRSASRWSRWRHPVKNGGSTS